MILENIRHAPTHQDPHVTFRPVEKLSVCGISLVSYPEQA